MIDHTGIGVADVAARAAFYDADLAPLGLRRVAEIPKGDGSDGVAYGVDQPELWIDRFHPHGQKQHTAFAAGSRAEVDGFHAGALKAGATDHGPPGLRDASTGYRRGTMPPSCSTPTETTSRPCSANAERATPRLPGKRRPPFGYPGGMREGEQRRSAGMQRVAMLVALAIAVGCGDDPSGDAASTSNGAGGAAGATTTAGSTSSGTSTGATSSGAGGGASTIAHGSDLTRDMVGPAGLGVSIEQLRPTAVDDERISTWPTDGLPSWIPNAPYVYDDDPANHGGIVPDGGMTIDGFQVPGGTWVVQFDDFGSDSIIVSGDNDGTSPALPGVVFRGCRWRGAVTAPGFLNVYANSHTAVWILFSDAGGLGAEDGDYNEIPFKLSDETTNSVYYRNYISYTTTAIQPGSISPQIIENYIEKITYYYDGEPPPGESTGKHLNGISLNGGQTSALIVRNKVLLQSPDDAGRTVDQTDCIYFKQEPAEFPGTGQNVDGSQGYNVSDNYIGGGGYSIYAGWDSSEGPPEPQSVTHMVLRGNLITTQWWPMGGSLGPLAKEPPWDVTAT